MRAATRLRVALLLLSSAVVILIGQLGRELLAPDDLREVEVAREMYEGGDYVVPHLAGLPFVEKPSGFPAAVATAYRLVGGPSAPAARATSAAFALASLTAVFLLGSRILGVEGGALAAAVLAVSGRFCRTAHEVLLDNALTAAVAFTVLFAWLALEAESPRRKRLAYAAAGLSLGVAFLFKGFVGPVLFGSGFLLYLVWSRRLGELRHVFRPLPIVAFLVPFLGWVAPFLLRAPSHLVHEFFVTNYFGRFSTGTLSNRRPWYFYLLDVWPAFAPASLLLPWALREAWRTRGGGKDRAGLYLVALSLGPLLPLSLSSAKDSVYLLPVYPALATLVAWCVVRDWRARAPGRTWPRWAAAAVVLLAVATALAVSGVRGGVGPPLAVASGLGVLGAAGCLLSLRAGDLRWASTCAVALLAVMWSLWFTGPLAHAEVARSSMRHDLAPVLKAVGHRDIVLFASSDGLRGAASFYRDRTAEELGSAQALVARLKAGPGTVAALLYSDDGAALPAGVEEAARAEGASLDIEKRFRLSRRFLVLVTARHPAGTSEAALAPRGD